MTDVRPLLLLAERHDRVRDDALAAQRRARAARDAALAQAEQLRAYRVEYEARWAARFRSEGRIELLRCYQGFADRLTDAVAQQAEIVEQTAAQLEFADAAAHEAELRCASVRKLIDRRLDERRRDADRRDRKQADEIAARAAWGRRAGGHAAIDGFATTPMPLSTEDDR